MTSMTVKSRQTSRCTITLSNIYDKFGSLKVHIVTIFHTKLTFLPLNRHARIIPCTEQWKSLTSKSKRLRHTPDLEHKPKALIVEWNWLRKNRIKKTKHRTKHRLKECLQTKVQQRHVWISVQDMPYSKIWPRALSLLRFVNLVCWERTCWRLKDCLAKRPQTLKGLLGVKEDLALWLATALGMACIWTCLKHPEKNPHR